MEILKLSDDSKPLSVETFNLTHEGKECKLTLTRTSKSLKLNLNLDDYVTFFEGNFTYEEVVKLNNIFRIFSSLEEIQKSLTKIISLKKNIELKKIKNNQINLNLKENVFEKKIEVNIPLIQREISQKEMNEKLMNENRELKKEISYLKEDNKNIKMNLELIQEKMKEFMEFKNNYINTFKIDNMNIPDSKIALTKEHNSLIINRLKLVEKFKQCKNFKFQLLYRGTKDGDDSETFHKLCDNKENILVLVETTKNRKFGGFCSIGYKSYGGEQKDNSAFIFSLDKLKTFNVIKNGTACYWGEEYGPLFAGSMIVVNNKFFTNTNYSNSKNNYYELSENYELNGGEYEYFIKEIEVYKIN